VRARGTQRLVGTVLRINRGMLELAANLGFQETDNPGDPDDHGTRFVSLELQPTTSPDARPGSNRSSPLRVRATAGAV